MNSAPVMPAPTAASASAMSGASSRAHTTETVKPSAMNTTVARNKSRYASAATASIGSMTASVRSMKPTPLTAASRVGCLGAAPLGR